MVYINFNKHYEGYNRAMGKYIFSKRHYEEEMKEGGFIPYEEAEERIAKQNEKRKTYTTSKKAHDILEACRPYTDKKGNVNMPERAVEALKSMGMKFDRSLPEKYRNVKEGGFDNA